MRRNSKKPIIFIVIFVLIVVVLVVLSAKNRSNVAFIDNVTNVTVKPVARVFGSIGQSIGGFFDNFKNKKNLIKTIEELTYKNNMLEQKNSALVSLENENDRLRKLLDLKEKYPSFETKAATVIAKDGGNYSRFITIDKGEESGFAVNQAVISGDGLVGLLFEVGHGWSKIQTILDPSTSAGCRVTRTGDISITEGDVALLNQGQLKMLYISKQFPIIDGDIVETSGLGEIYPRGIPIGRIKEIKVAENSSVQYATVAPIVDFSNIFDVLVIVKK